MARPGAGDRIPGQERHLVQHRRPGRRVDVRRRPQGLRAGRQARRLHDLLPRPEPGHDRRRPPRTGQGRRRGRPPAGLGQTGRPVLVLPAARRRDLGRRDRQRLRLRPDQLLHHQRRVHERARRRARRAHRQGLHPGRDGLPRRPHRTRRAALPRGVGEVPARPRPRPPAADHQGTRRLLVPLRQPRRAAGEDPAHARGRLDMVAVFLSNPFTAERDIANIGSSILARA